MKKLMLMLMFLSLFPGLGHSFPDMDSSKNISDNTGNNPWFYMKDTEIFSGKKIAIYTLKASDYANIYEAPYLTICKVEGQDVEVWFSCGSIVPRTARSLDIRVGTQIFKEDFHTGKLNKYLILHPPVSAMWTILKLDAIKGAESELAILVPEIEVQAKWKVHNLKKVLAELGCP